MGPQHPATHGVLRLVLELEGEVILNLEPVIGYLRTAAIDLNVTSLLMYCFRDREEILDIFEMVSGQRMMHGYFRIGGLQWDLPQGFAERVQRFLDDLPRRLDEYETLLTDNLIWRKRTEGVPGL